MTSNYAQSRSVVIGTAGHIDHGKTTLVRALTGIDTDRLPEEKRRGITIDLGFASLETKTTNGDPLQLSFIDVPGHHLFIRNMLAGTGGIDAVMLVISAEEGVKPQTEEHLAICEMLGIRLGLTVVTKADAVSDTHLEDVRHSIRQFLSNTFLNADRAPMIDVSAYSGAGLDSLRSELVSLAARVPARNSDALPRLPIDRAFVMKGFGTVVTGTLLTGAFKTGQTLAIEPGRRSVRVRGMQTHGRPQEMGQAGSRVALNLTGVDAAEVQRGETVVETSTLVATDTIDVEVTLLANAPELRHRSRVHFHAFSSEATATLSLYGHESAEAGSTRLMRLRLNKRIVLVPGDPFVLRQLSPAMTIGGGRVLDAEPIPNLRKTECLKWLDQLRSASIEQQLLMRVARHGTDGLHLHALSGETGLTAEAIGRLIRSLIDGGKLVCIADNLLLIQEALQRSTDLVVSEFESRLKASIGLGLRRSELKSHTKLSDEVFDFALKELEKKRKLRVQEEWINYFSFDGQSPEKDRRLLAVIATAFESAGLTSPSPDEVASKLSIDSGEMRRLMTLLLRDKTLIKLGGEELYMHQLVLAKLRFQVRGLRGQKMDVGDFKQLTGLSRKYAIPLLEYLDREHITRKQGEHRLVL